MNNFASFLSKNKPGLLMGFGIGSMIASTIVSFRLGYKAKEAVDEKKEELGVEELSPKETARTVATYAAAPLILDIIGVVSILSGNQMNLNRGAAAVAAYAASETAFREYREQTKQAVGEKKEQQIRESVAKEIVENRPLKAGEIVVTGKGDCLCFDDVANQYFRSSKTQIEKIINRLNFEMMDSMTTVTVNDYCLAMGLDTVLLGNDIGWTVDGAGIISPDIIVQERCDEPCFVITHSRREPRPLY